MHWSSWVKKKSSLLFHLHKKLPSLKKQQIPQKIHLPRNLLRNNFISLIYFPMTLSFGIWLLWSLILVTGAARPVETTKIPYKSIKNWLFGVGGLIMLLYAILGYLNGGPVFFIFLEVLVAISSILMMLNTNDRFDTTILSISGIVLIVWSLTLFEWYSTILFILGLIGLGLGYAFKMNTLRRDLALMIGSLFVAVFSYIEASRVFFWLNIFFALFSLYYTISFILHHRKKAKKNK